VSFFIDDAYIEACREVDALFPETPPIAPVAESVMKKGLDMVRQKQTRNEQLRRFGIALVSESRDEWLYNGRIVSGKWLRSIGGLTEMAP